MAAWFITRDGNSKYGPFDEQQLKDLIAAGRLSAADLVWQEGMSNWVAASSLSFLKFSPEPPPTLPPHVQQTREVALGDKVAAGICGILLGSFGVHKFILGMTTPGVIMLAVTLLTCGLGGLVMGGIGIIEGIIYLTKSDEDFYQTYIVGKRAWF